MIKGTKNSTVGGQGKVYVCVCPALPWLHLRTSLVLQSLFHRIQLEPVEKAWMRSSALGDTEAQRQLLLQESSLAMKKVKPRPRPRPLHRLRTVRGGESRSD